MGVVLGISPLHSQVSILPLQLLGPHQILLSFLTLTFRPFTPLRRCTPHLEQLVNSFQHSFSSSSPKHKEHFIDLSTGIRLHYFSWPHTSDDIILLLHDIANSATSWIELGTKLYNRGYTVFALDLRGHGCTDPSSSNNYSASHLAEDVNAFIIAKDLYIRPVAVVGCGIGGAVALTLANKAPNLIGAVAVLDFGLSPAVEQDSTSSSAAEMLPWWSFWLGQGLKFQSPAQCAAFLMSPLTHIGPAVFTNLLSSTTKEDTEEIKQILDRLTRPPAAAAQNAVSMLRPSTAKTAQVSFRERFLDDDLPAELEINMDPAFFFNFDIDAMKRSLNSIKAHLLVVHGERSAMVPPEAAATLARLAEQTAASITVVQIPQTGHYVLQDAPNDVHNALVKFLEGPAVRCFNIDAESLPNSSRVGGGDTVGIRQLTEENSRDANIKNSRRPEVLGIRPLPEYASLEEAKKALGPRSIPTADAIDQELRKLRLEERAETGVEAPSVSSSSDDEEGGASKVGGEDRKAERKRRTALSQDPSDYFGFVG